MLTPEQRQALTRYVAGNYTAEDLPVVGELAQSVGSGWDQIARWLLAQDAKVRARKLPVTAAEYHAATHCFGAWSALAPEATAMASLIERLEVAP